MRAALIGFAFLTAALGFPIASHAATCPNLYRNLSFGSRGSDVAQLQTFLIEQNHLAAGNSTGYFGRMTEGAVKQFQCKHMSICSGDARSTGYGAVRTLTRAKIAEVCATLATPASPTAPATPTAPVTPVQPAAPTQPAPTQTIAPAPAPTTAVAGLSTTPVTRLWLHHEYRDSVDPINPNSQPQTPAYSAFMGAAWNQNYSVANMPQKIKSQYVITSAALGVDFDASYPSVLRYDAPGFDSDEHMFIHASDPASLYVASGNEGTFTIWQPDDRTGQAAAATYNLYRYIAPGIVNTTTLQWWKSVSWEKIASPSASVYQDTGLSCSIGNCTPIGATVCYMVRSVNAGGVESNYSLPRCTTYRGWQDRDVLWWDGAAVFRTVSAPRGDTYADNTYRIDIAFNQIATGSLKKIDAFAYGFPSVRDGCGSGAATQVNQCSTGFGQIGTVSLDGSQVAAGTPGDFTAALTFSSIRPIIQIEENKNNTTVDPVFRIRMTDKSGAEYWYPQDGGYLTTRPNNRIFDRLWINYQTNPANESWQRALMARQSTLAGLGYNTLYLDEWRPLKSIDWEGLSSEAPAIEYPYPTGGALVSYLQNSSPSDAWTQALGQLAAKLRSNQPNMRLVGNTIHRWVGEAAGYTGLIRQAANLLDGAVEEECLAGGGGIHTGAQWLADLSVMEEYAQSGKIVVCLTRSNPLHSTAAGVVDDGIVPARRMFLLVSWLLIDDPNKQMYFAPAEINTEWIKYSAYQYPQINIFPEYFVPLGKPVGARTQVGSIWKRDFEKGVVYVNPSSSSASYTIPAGLNKVSIVGVVNQPYTGAGSCEKYASGKCEENPGRVEFVLTPAGSYNLASGEAAIFVK